MVVSNPGQVNLGGASENLSPLHVKLAEGKWILHVGC